MNRIRFITTMVVALLLIAGCGTKETVKEKSTIVLTNPTVANLQIIQTLVEQKVFTPPGEVTYLCAYHPSQSYNFERSARYIADNELSNFILVKMECELTVDNLFIENECSDQYLSLFRESDGIFFFGGPDIPPAVYGEENTLSVVTDPGRHYFETNFLFHLLGSYNNEEFTPFLEERPDYLVTGFCLGMQTMNVATGGSLIQDIPSEIFNATTAEEKVALEREQLHRNYWQYISNDSLLMRINFHTIKFTEHPFFGETIDLPKDIRPYIYSSHHQSVKAIGKGFEVTALSSDGKIIEAIAHSKYPNVFAVQFHPEVTSLYEQRFMRKFAPDDEPRSYFEILGDEGVMFHRAYWRHISKGLGTRD